MLSSDDWLSCCGPRGKQCVSVRELQRCLALDCICVLNNWCSFSISTLPFPEQPTACWNHSSLKGRNWLSVKTGCFHLFLMPFNVGERRYVTSFPPHPDSSHQSGCHRYECCQAGKSKWTLLKVLCCAPQCGVLSVPLYVNIQMVCGSVCTCVFGIAALSPIKCEIRDPSAEKTSRNAAKFCDRGQVLTTRKNLTSDGEGLSRSTSFGGVPLRFTMWAVGC